jgi:ABC-type multidrug transport system permease subunit
MNIQKFMYMLAKDTEIFLRDIRSFMLLFLTPILIVILVGIAFLSTQPSHVPVIICGESKENGLYKDTYALLKNSGTFDLSEQEGYCREIISQKIKNSNVRAGIIIPEQSANATIEILIDNTKPVSTYIESYFNLITKDMSQKLMNAMISDMWSNIDNISEQIDAAEDELNSFSQTLGKASNDLSSISGDASVIKNGISAIKNAKTGIDYSISTLQGLRNNVASISSGLDTVDEKSRNIQNTINSLNVSIFAQSMLADDITSIQNSITAMRIAANSAENGINSLELSLKNAQNVLENANLDDMERRLNNIVNSLSETSSSIARVKNRIDSLANRLRAAKNNILTASDKYKPVYSEPVNSKISRYFGNKRYIDFVFPTILVMILMLMSTFLSSTSFIRQRSTGLLKRISISTTSFNFLLVEKTIFNAFISLIPLPFILTAGVLVLGIEINIYNAIPIILVCAILSIVFVLVGLIIASFSRTESTAILASLIFVVPMMFLSGAFTPFEAFPPAFQVMAASMPITISARLIEGLTFYVLPLDTMGILLAFLLAYIAITALIARMLIKRGI